MQNVGFTILIYLLSGYAFFILFTALLELVIKFREVFPHKSHSEMLEEQIYSTLEDYNDGFVEDEANYDERITEMKIKLDEILKPEIITDEYERSLEI